MGTVLTSDEIFAIDDRKIEFVIVPEWCTDEDKERGVFVMGLSGTDRDSFDMAMIEQRQIGKGKTTAELNLRNLRAKLIVRTAVSSDEPQTAKSIFTEAQVDALGKKNGAALQRIYEVAQRLSGLSPEDVEELTKDLGEGQSSDSGSDSLHTLATPLSLLPSDGSAVESSPNGESSTLKSPSESGV